jgi:type IV secretion system protein VirD4
MVIPNLLFWDESVIIQDYKAENYRLTSGYRKNVLGQKVFLWDPAGRGEFTHHYNPLDHLKSKNLTSSADEIQKIVQTLVPADSTGANDVRLLVAALISCVIADETRSATLGEVLRILSVSDLDRYLESMSPRLASGLEWFGQLKIGAFLARTPGEKRAIVNLAIAALDLWSDPEINRATSESDFSLEDFSGHRSTLYVAVHPSDSTRLRPLLQIFYQQCISALTLRIEDLKDPPPDRVGVLMLLDEFGALGKMVSMENVPKYSRGYRLKICSLVHSLDDLENTCGDGKVTSALDGYSVIVACCTNDRRTAGFLSELLGDRIVTRADGSRLQEPLLLPQEIANLGMQRELIVFESLAIGCDKIAYYKDPKFSGKVLEPAHS